MTRSGSGRDMSEAEAERLEMAEALGIFALADEVRRAADDAERLHAAIAEVLALRERLNAASPHCPPCGSAGQIYSD